MSHHTRFDQEVNARLARQRREAQVCSECGGRFWRAGNRVWHTFECSQNPVHRKPSRPQSEREQDAEREALAGPRCPHGFADPSECPGCLDLADRLRQEHDPEAAL